MKFTSFDIPQLRPEVLSVVDKAVSDGRLAKDRRLAVYDIIMFNLTDLLNNAIDPTFKVKDNLGLWNEMVAGWCETEIGDFRPLPTQTNSPYFFNDFDYHALVPKIREYAEMCREPLVELQFIPMHSVDEIVTKMLEFLHKLCYDDNWKSFKQSTNLSIWNNLLKDRIELLNCIR